jgi:hypothetical protein
MWINILADVGLICMMASVLIQIFTLLSILWEITTKKGGRISRLLDSAYYWWCGIVVGLVCIWVITILIITSYIHINCPVWEISSCGYGKNAKTGQWVQHCTNHCPVNFQLHNRLAHAFFN